MFVKCSLDHELVDVSIEHFHIISIVPVQSALVVLEELLEIMSVLATHVILCSDEKVQVEELKQSLPVGLGPLVLLALSSGPELFCFPVEWSGSTVQDILANFGVILESSVFDEVQSSILFEWLFGVAVSVGLLRSSFLTRRLLVENGFLF